LNKQEQALRLTIFNEEVVSVMRKLFLPIVEGGEPLHQVTDLWSPTQINLDGMPFDEALMKIEARARFLEYIDQQLKVLGGNGKEDIKFSSFSLDRNASPPDKLTNLITRQIILKHIEDQLMQTALIAGTKEETEEEMLKRIYSNSNK